MIKSKICSNKDCSFLGHPQDLSDFSKTKHHSDGLASRCKTCTNAYHSRRKHLKKEYDVQYRKENETKIKEQKKFDYIKNPEIPKARSKKWFKDNKDRAYARNKKRFHSDVWFKLATNLRIRMRMAIKNNQKRGSAVKDLGCTIEFLKTYLESLWQPGMTWENWSHSGWHIDHIRPLSSFDLGDREEFLKACHYTNLQPLWAKDNFKKSDKYEPTST